MALGRVLAAAVTVLAAAMAWPVAAGAAGKGRDVAPRTSREISLSVSSLYGVTVAAGTWVPVVIDLADRGHSSVRGELSITAPVPTMATAGSAICFTNSSSGGTSCSYSFAGSSNSVGDGGYLSRPSATMVTEKVPFELAAGTAKQLQADVLASSTQSRVHVEAVMRSGRVLASATSQLAVDNGTVVPDVLVVTNETAALSSLSMALPDGSQPQVQFLGPSELPGNSAALGAFAAVLVDEADTGVLTAGQAEALRGYVETGGTLVVAGGRGWRAATLGLPPGLVPARVEGTASEAIPQVARLLAAPVPGLVDVDRLAMGQGSVALMAQAGLPLAVEARRGNGYVIMSALDPAAAPLADWSGDEALLSRLMASGFQYVYYNGGATVSQGGVVSIPAVAAPLLEGEGPGPTSLMSPVMASSVLSGYLEDVPGVSPPSTPLLGLLLLGYVLVAGPLCFLALRRLHRRELAWVVVPCLAVAAALAAYVTAAGMARTAKVDEIQVAQLSPGSTRAHVSSLGSVYLPRGGSVRMTLATSGPVTDLGARAGADLTVTTGARPAEAVLTVSGPGNSLGGWATTEDSHIKGHVDASVQVSAGVITGVVTNGLGVTLTNAYVVEGSSSANLGTLAPGASVRFSLLTSSQPPSPSSGVTPRILSPSSSAAARHQEAVFGMDILGTEYANDNDGGPVLVALARTAFLPPDTHEGALAYPALDVVVVPLGATPPPGGAVSALGPELVGSRDFSGFDGGAGATSFTLGNGGFFDYQFLVPSGTWRSLALNLGSSIGLATPTEPGTLQGVGVPASSGQIAVSGLGFSASAFDYRTGSWAGLPVSVSRGHFRVVISHPADYIGLGGAVEVRLSALAAGLEVVGPVPTLSGRL